jgi:hypothetical protein
MNSVEPNNCPIRRDMNNKMEDAIRTVGYLLETNGTTGYFARNSHGYPVGVNDAETCRWCLQGAVEAVALKFGLLVGPLVGQVQTILNARSGLVSAWEGKYAKLSQQEVVTKLKTYRQEASL